MGNAQARFGEIFDALDKQRDDRVSVDELRAWISQERGMGSKRFSTHTVQYHIDVISNKCDLNNDGFFEKDVRIQTVLV